MVAVTARKLRKLIVTPDQFIADAWRKHRLASFKLPFVTTPPRIFVFGLSPWKEFLAPFFPGSQLIYISRRIEKREFMKTWAHQIGRRQSDRMLIWGFKAPSFATSFVERQKVPLLFVEDGFLRSIELGASKAPPFSLCIDSRTPHFDARRPSDLEKLLQRHDFGGDPRLMIRARQLADRIILMGLSKYNQGSDQDLNQLIGSRSKRRILVLGQVEDDASITYGCKTAITNNQLVELAHRENPHSQIIYKPHPDVMNGHRGELSDPAEIKDICCILQHDISLAQVLGVVDHVYTITSLGGFEAALRGLPVTTLGCPFYAGWGFTDDRQSAPRRTRILSPLEVFAGAYILYPRYADPVANQPGTIESVIEQLASMRAQALAEAATG